MLASRSMERSVMSEEYYPESHEKIYPEDEKIYLEELEYGSFHVDADVKRAGKTAKLEKVDNPSIVYYSQISYVYPRADFSKIYAGNYILTVTGEDRKEYVTVFPSSSNVYRW